MNNIFIVLVIVASCGASVIPSIFTKCKINDNLSKCLINSVNKGWPRFVKTYNLDKIPIAAHDNIPHLFEFWLTNAHMEGFENIVFNQFYVNFNNRSFDIIYSQPKLSMIGDYEILGNFLGFKFYDVGRGNGTYINGLWKFHFDYDIEKRNGDEYIKLTTYRLESEVERLVVTLNSTVSRQQGERLAALFNKYWRIFNILAESYLAKFISAGYIPFIQDYLNHIPFKSLFK